MITRGPEQDRADSRHLCSWYRSQFTSCGDEQLLRAKFVMVGLFWILPITNVFADQSMRIPVQSLFSTFDHSFPGVAEVVILLVRKFVTGRFFSRGAVNTDSVASISQY